MAMDDVTMVQSASSLAPVYAARVTQPRRHNIPRLLLIIITIAIYIITEAVLRPSPGSRLFMYTPAELERMFECPITAIPAIASIVWPVVYIFQACWLFCACYAIFRKTTTIQNKSDGSQIVIESYLYLYPDVFQTHTFYL